MKIIQLVILLAFFSPGFSQARNEKLNGILIGSKIAWKTYKTEHFNFFVETDRYADQHFDVIKSDFEKIRNKIIRFLGESNFVDTANIIILDTKEKVKNILGFEAQGFAIPEDDMAFFLSSTEYTLATKHELTHYYAFKIWGRPVDNWFSEGLAVYYDNKWNGQQIDSLSKRLKDSHSLFKLSFLITRFYSLNSMIAYPQIGSFTSFLLSEYGLLKLRELWTKGFAEIRGIYGKSLKEMEREWLRFLDGFQNDNSD